MKNFIPNYNILQIESSEGFKDFKGIITNENQEMIDIYIDNRLALTCTLDHKIKTTNNDIILAKDLKINDKLKFRNNTLIISNIIKRTDLLKSYEPLHVLDVHDYLTINHKLLILNNNCLYIDEVAFIPNDVEFYTSTYPVITAGKTTKVIMTSTPKGMNLFYKLWTEAEQKINDYVPYQVRWQEHPDRDEKWYKEQSANLSAVQISQEFECVGGDTMININGSDIMIKNLHGKYSNVLWK